MKFDSASLLEEILWDMRVSDQPRAADRAVILKLYNGAPPYDDSTVEANQIQINVNDLEGTNVLSQARRQWNSAFLKPANYFICRADAGPGHKRAEWSQKVTRNLNKLLKRDSRMMGQIRATGANTILYGIGPTMWRDRRSVIPSSLPVGSLLIPSETEIDDFNDSVSYLAMFREMTAVQLYEATHGPKVDPGWNMPLVKVQLDYIRDELRKSPNALAYQYMPERIEELIKQDKGYFGSDAVPTVDVWDFYFREAENGKGWYRRMVLDWGVGAELPSYISTGRKPNSRNRVGEETQFLYSSGHRKYANSLSEILHCQFGDCSPYAPVKYHSIRGLGWMLWGICDLQNRLHCKFNEAVFEQLMWFFQTASNQDLMRLKKANFEHMGVIPQGIRFLTANERFTPDKALLDMAFARNQKLISDSSTTYTQDYEQTSGSSARTATETMAIVNSSQALASGILEMAYTYEAFKDREIFRRACIKNSKDRIASEFQKKCLQDGIPEDMLDPDKWDIEPEQVIGGGNKTVQMAIVQFLQQIRQNLPPNGQRIVDNMSISAATDIPELAEEMAPLGDTQPISNSMHDAQQATSRLLRGLPFQPPKEAVFEDYVIAWLHDLALEVQKIVQRGGMANPDEIAGLNNLGQHIGIFLAEMAKETQGPKAAQATKEKVRQYEQALSDLMNHVKSFAQRLQQAMQAQAKQQTQGNGQSDGKREAALIMAQTKAQIAERSSAQRTQQKQVQWEMGERRKDLQTQADIAREGIRTRHELMANRLKVLAE